MANFIPADYIDVQQRINRFWAENPQGRIETELVSPPANFEQCRYVARVFCSKDDARPTVTGWAFELAGGAGANRTSHEENCETSAIGRALANLGYAKTGEERPSRQEVTKVAAPAPQRGVPPQESARPAGFNGSGPTDKQIKYMQSLARENGLDNDGLHAQVNARFGKASLHDLTGGKEGEASRMIEYLKNRDLIDGVPVKVPRVDAVEAAQQGLDGLPEEPDWLRQAPGLDRYS